MNDMTFDQCFRMVDDFVACSAAGTTSQEDIARFDRFLAGSELGRQVYTEHLLATLALPSVMAKILPGEPLSEAVVETADRRLMIDDSEPPETWRQQLKWAMQDLVAHPFFFPLVIASLFLATVLLTLAIIPNADRQPIAMPEVADRPEVIAFIRSDVDAVWAGAKEAAPSSLLHPGDRLELQAGLAEIAFRSGAKVVLQGPCLFTPLNPMLGDLNRGRLLARVDERSTGFAIQTPTALIVDLGTEFSVETEDDAGTTTHVVSGEVAVELRNGESRQRTVVRAGGAAQVTTDGRQVRLLDGSEPPPQLAEMKALLDQRRPERYLAADNDQSSGPPLEKLALWLAADAGTARNDAGHVQFWRDMRRSSDREPPAVFAPEESRAPLWVADGLNDRPALRFEGDDVMRLPASSDLSLAETVYECFVVAQSRHSSIQFLIAGGLEHYELHINSGSGVRFIPAAPYHTGEPGAANRSSDLGQPEQFSSDRGPHIFSARVFPADNERSKTHGVVRVDGVDGNPTPQDSAASTDRTPLQFGMRNDGTFPWLGEIAEILIYTRALTEAERAQVEEYLADKYGLTIRQEIEPSDTP